MRIIKQILALFSVLTGCVILFLACSIPVYFTSIDKHIISTAGKSTKTLEDVAMLTLDSSQVSTALIFSQSVNMPEPFVESAKRLLKKYPVWRVSGGDSPFFETFCSTIDLPKGDFVPVYDVLASRENRKKMTEFLKQSKNAGVKKILEMRNLNTVMLPPAYTNAGAPFEASLLTLALLSQSSNMSESFAYEFSQVVADIANPTTQDKFEKCIIGVLALSKNLDYSSLSSLFKVFKHFDEVFEFAKIFTSQKDMHFRCCMYSASIMIGNAQLCSNYLKDAQMQKWGNLSFALGCGEGGVRTLLENDKPIYENSPFEEYIDAYCSPMKNLFSSVCVKNLQIALAIKVLITLIGTSVIASGILRFVGFSKDGAFYSFRCILIGIVLSILFFVAIEPSAFDVKIQNNEATDIKIVFNKIKSNIVGDKDIMSIDTDTATLAAIALFFVVQMIVYIVCLVRISVIKRTKANASLKLKLLENEDNLFDLGLYIGLSGTVASLILLTFGVITASLMAGYTSTLFGILFTALVKIVHLRKFKRKLLIEAANE